MKEGYVVIYHKIVSQRLIEVATENLKNRLKNVGERVLTVVGIKVVYNSKFPRKVHQFT